MRRRSWWTVLVLGAAFLLAQPVPAVRAADTSPYGTSAAAPAEAPRPAAPREGTADEEDTYARREAASPAAGEFTGGDGVVEVVLVIGILILVYLLLKKAGDI